MNWLAVLLALASIGGSPVPGAAKPKPHCAGHAKHCKAVPKKKPSTKKTKPKAPVATPAPAAGKTPTTVVNPSPRAGDPTATPTPTVAPKATPTPTPVPTATPIATPNPFPTRTGVDISEWRVRPSYRTLAAGEIDFNVTDLGEDDHNLSIRGGGKEYGGLDLHPGDADVLTVTLAPGTYTLYCNIPTHEALGMRADITVR